MRYWLGTAAVAALLAVPSLAPQSYAQAVPGYEAPNYQALCANGVRKLDLAIEVIGAGPAQIDRARAAAPRAQDFAQRGDHYNCAEQARAGMNALDAG
jgi:hypothetical protein